MAPEVALKLVAIVEAYFTRDEFEQFVKLFELDLSTLEYGFALDNKPWLPVAAEISAKLDHGNTRRFIDSLIELAETRNSDSIANSQWERRDYHGKMAGVLKELKDLLESGGPASEIAVPAGHTFSAKSKVRELVESATANVFIVDPYVGIGTLDCLRNIDVPIRLLTGAIPQSIEAGFDRALAAFQQEGHKIDVRRANQLHDRHIILNDRCWLVGSSLKDAGKKPFNCIEITDEKANVIAGLEKKWNSSTVYP